MNIPGCILGVLALMLLVGTLIVLVQLVEELFRYLLRWHKWLFRQGLALLRKCKPFIVSGLVTLVLATAIWVPILHVIYS